jgi:hypothetical protein
MLLGTLLLGEPLQPMLPPALLLLAAGLRVAQPPRPPA